MTENSLAIPELRAPVEIDIDRWGVSHIRADNRDDLFLAQGFVAARDRLWQIDLWRKRGLGLLAADFGPGYLAQDYASRLFLYRGDMDDEWASYGPDARQICDAFARGVNSYIDLIAADADRLPPEFVELGTLPAKWQADDVVRIRTHGWMRNAVSELLRANILARAGAGADLLRMNLEPPVVPRFAEGLDPLAVPQNALDLYKLAIAPVTFPPERLSAPLADAWSWTRVSPAGDVVRLTPQSNNWAVHGSRTATGRPILATDPHRAYGLPSLRYLVHLTAPDLDLIGAVEPNFPGITIGHNGAAAFGLTLFLGPDQEDVYVYETNPAEPDTYRYAGEWEPVRVRHETFEVKGARPQTLPQRFTRHGPILFESAGTRQAIAIRSVWSEPGTTPYGAALAAMQARSLDEFRAAMRRWKVPAVNQVYADRAGRIAWITGAAAPIRRNWEGLLPVPGDGRFEWDGFLDPVLLPHAIDPPEGFVASANAMNLPADWPRSERPMGYEWDDPSRARRIEELLGAGLTAGGSAPNRHSIDDSRAMQQDVVSLPARRLCAMLARVSFRDSDSSAAAQLLRNWNHRLDRASAAAALFEIWWSRHLRPEMLARGIPNGGVRSLAAPGDVETMLLMIEHADARLGPMAAERRDALLGATLSAAFRECVERMGPDPAEWTWGSQHQLQLDHLGRRAVGPIPLGGSESTLNKAAYRVSDLRVTMGASVRIVVDVGEWHNSVWINMPGQSGDPRSRHFADLVDLWARGEYVPMAYSRAAVEAVTEERITLRPRI